MRILTARPALFLILCSAVLLAGCGGPSVDVGKAVVVGESTTGWFDAGIVNGQNKLVPSATFTVKNTGTEKLSGLQVYCVFRLVGETEELGSSLVILRGKEALEAGATSKAITARANWGFTGEQPRAQMLMHTSFKDAQIQIFVKYGAAPFAKIHEAQVTRQLLTQ
jgi:hypothetical protein